MKVLYVNKEANAFMKAYHSGNNKQWRETVFPVTRYELPYIVTSLSNSYILNDKISSFCSIPIQVMVEDM